MRIINIDIPVAEMQERKERVETLLKRGKPDRIPITINYDTMFWLPKLAVEFKDYFGDAKTMLECQLRGFKWFLENVKCDDYTFTLGPNFENTDQASSLGCEVVFPVDGVPWVKPWVTDNADLKRLRSIDVTRSGLHRKGMELRDEMVRLSGEYRVLFDGDFFFDPLQTIGVPMGSHGPFSDAADLMGHEQIYLEVYHRPDFVKELLDIVTDKAVEYEESARRTLGTSMTANLGPLADDSAAYLSAEMFDEFALPYLKRFRDHFGGRLANFHLCGRSDHLFERLANELKIDVFDYCGAPNDREKMLKILGGKMILQGGVDACRIRDRETIVDDVMQSLRVFENCRGFMFHFGLPYDDCGLLENVSAIYQTVQEFCQK